MKSDSRPAIEGGCFCGDIRYAIDAGDYVAANCHCTMCRRIHAAPFVSWLVVPSNAFHYTKGAVNELQSSEHGARYFCAACGSHLACVNAGHPEIVDVTICSLDVPEAFPVSVEVFEDTRL